MDMIQSAIKAKKVSVALASTTTEQKNTALKLIADYLKNNKEDIIRANEEDIQRSIKENLPEVLLKRLKFDSKNTRWDRWH